MKSDFKSRLADFKSLHINQAVSKEANTYLYKLVIWIELHRGRPPKLPMFVHVYILQLQGTVLKTYLFEWLNTGTMSGLINVISMLSMQ